MVQTVLGRSAVAGLDAEKDPRVQWIRKTVESLLSKKVSRALVEQQTVAIQNQTH